MLQLDIDKYFWFALILVMLIKLVYSQRDILDKAMEIHAARVNDVS